MITVIEKTNDYAVFSHAPNTKVYLGDCPIEDYIHDEENQLKRSASCYYYEIATGKKVSQDEVFGKEEDGNIELVWHGEEFTHENDKISNYKYGYKCDYDFERKTAFGGMESLTGPQIKYNQRDKSSYRLAWIDFMQITPEEYDKREAKFAKEREDDARKSPYLHNLMWVDGRMYYVDDNKNEISLDQHIELMKKKFGDDVFELAEKRRKEENPELYELSMKLAEKTIKRMQNK